MKKVLVLGSRGQLASAFKNHKGTAEWTFLGHSEIDLTDSNTLADKLSAIAFDVLINCAAYTAVDKAETDQENAYQINAHALKPIAEVCKEKNALFVHFSTDYVFGKIDPIPLEEKMATLPTGVYGKSKLLGEETIRRIHEQHLIIRTSWLYGANGHNFLKTMLNLGSSREILNVVYDQVGTPTLVDDLAASIVKILDRIDTTNYGIYHYSNEGVCSWYDFALAIFEISQIRCKVLPVLSSAFPTPAERPNYSVLNKQKIKDTFDLEIPHWRLSLAECLKAMNYA